MPGLRLTLRLLQGFLTGEAPPTPITNNLLLENGTDSLLLEDGISILQLE